MSTDHVEGAEIASRARTRVGTMIGSKYRLDALLGVGGMAAVYRASHRNGATFAIKLLHSEYGMRADVRARFLREGYIANSIKHVGVARVVDDEAIENGDAYIVMELLEGVSVDRLASRFQEKLPTRAVVALGIAVLDVLAAAHAAGVVHRDIKPANLFVGFDGRAVLLDFGIARVYDAANAGGLSTAAGVVLGTPAFMAPEQASGEKAAIGPRTDLWSLAATMFTITSGRTVHPGDSGPQFLVQSATRDAPSLRDVAADVPEAIAAVIDRALSRQPDDRFADADEMREALITASRAAWGNVASAPDLALLFAPTTRLIDRESAEAITQIAQEPTPVTHHTPPGADAFFRGVVHTVRDLGVDTNAALEAIGITPSKLAETPTTSAHLVDFLENAARIGAQPSLGVKTAFGLPLGASGALDYATRTSSTLRDALERTARLLSYVSDRVKLVLEEENDRVHLVFRPNPGAPTGPQIAEFLVAIVLHRAREALNSGVPISEIHFKHARVEGGFDLAEVFSAPIEYQQVRDEIVMPRSILYLRFETSDPMVADLLERHTERLTKRP
jgi:serine/threonine protein kinase